MDKEYLVGLLMNVTSKYKVNIDAEMLGKIVNMSFPHCGKRCRYPAYRGQNA